MARFYRASKRAAEKSGAGAREVLLKEWDVCEAGVSRYDTIIFTIRGWAITAVSAVIGFGFSNNDWRIAAVGVPTALLFWFVDGTNKSFQRFFLNRSRDVQEALRDPAAIRHDPARYATPRIAETFFAPPSPGQRGPYWWRRLGRIRQEMGAGNVAILYLGLVGIAIVATALILVPHDKAKPAPGVSVRFGPSYAIQMHAADPPPVKPGPPPPHHHGKRRCPCAGTKPAAAAGGGTAPAPAQAAPGQSL
jgi:hypothetical protein